MSQLAVPWLVLTTTHSPVDTGLVGTAEIAPYVVLQVLGAPLVDRFGGHRIAQLGNLVAALAMGAIPLVWAAGLHQLGRCWRWCSWPGWLGVRPTRRNGAGAGRSPNGPAMGIDRATALFDGVVPAGRPARRHRPAGVLIGMIGAANVVALDAGSFLAAVLLLAPGAGQRRRHRGGSATGYVRQLRESFAFVRKHPLLRSIAGMVLFTNFADAAMSGLFILLWTERHYGSSSRVGSDRRGVRGRRGRRDRR